MLSGIVILVILHRGGVGQLPLGAAVHVLVSQLKGLFGLDLDEQDGYFVKVFLVFYNLPFSNCS